MFILLRKFILLRCPRVGWEPFQREPRYFYQYFVGVKSLSELFVLHSLSHLVHHSGITIYFFFFALHLKISLEKTKYS